MLLFRHYYADADAIFIADADATLFSSPFSLSRDSPPITIAAMLRRATLTPFFAIDAIMRHAAIFWRYALCAAAAAMLLPALLLPCHDAIFCQSCCHEAPPLFR